jgi:hypothetical protein
MFSSSMQHWTRQKLPLPALKGRNCWSRQFISILPLFVHHQAKVDSREEEAEVAEEVEHGVDGAGVLKLNETETMTLHER